MEKKKFSLLFVYCFLFFAFGSLLLATLGCGKKKTKPVKQIEPRQTIVTPAPVVKPEPVKTKKIVYVYQGHRFRDPFIPLTGGLVTSKKLSEKLTAGNLRSFVVKGIIEDEKGKIALLTAPGGKNYLLKEGKLIDSEGKTITGIKGTIEKNKVVFFLGEGKVELNIMEENK